MLFTRVEDTKGVNRITRRAYGAAERCDMCAAGDTRDTARVGPRPFPSLGRAWALIVGMRPRARARGAVVPTCDHAASMLHGAAIPCAGNNGTRHY